MIDRWGRTGRHVLLVMAVSALLMILGGSALAQTYTPTPPPNVLELSTNTPGPGGTFEGRGCGFAPGSTVTITIGGQSVGTIVVGTDGCAVGTMTAPNAPGTYTVCYTGVTPSGGSQQLCNTITVASAQPATGTVPFTGTRNLLLIAIIGTSLLLVGTVLVVTFRRRQIPA